MKQQVKFYVRGSYGSATKQIETLQNHFNGMENVVLKNIYKDINKGDLDENCSELNNMLNEIEGGDIILVSSFDVLIKNTFKFFEFKSEIEKKGGILESIAPYDSSPTNKFTMLIMQRVYEDYEEVNGNEKNTLSKIPVYQRYGTKEQVEENSIKETEENREKALKLFFEGTISKKMLDSILQEIERNL